MAVPAPLVSVVVAVHNEAGTIAGCVRSLLRQTHRRLEVVVVDDGSTDATATIAGRFSGVKLLSQEHLGAGAARNRGAREAIGDILVFFDGDSVAEPDFLERLIAPMREGSVLGTFTKEILVANPHQRWARAHLVGRGLPPDRHFPPDFPDEFEIYRAIRRSDFFRVGGFDEVGYGEDVTVGRKLGVPAVAAPGAVFYHREPETLRDILRTAIWYGRGIRITEVPHRNTYNPYRILRRAAAMAVRKRMPSLAAWSIVWDVGVVFGRRTRERAGPGK